MGRKEAPVATCNRGFFLGGYGGGAGSGCHAVSRSSGAAVMPWRSSRRMKAEQPLGAMKVPARRWRLALGGGT